MINQALIILFLFFSIVSYGNSYEGEMTNNEHGTRTFSQILIEMPLTGLSKESLEGNKKAVMVYKNHTSGVLKKEYINIFPSKFSAFISIFQPNDYGQLYDGYIYINLFNQLSLEFPDLAAPKYLSLASEACFDADAPNYLREGLRKFKELQQYSREFSKLKNPQKQNVNLFLNASCHPHDNDSGFCKP